MVKKGDIKYSDDEIKERCRLSKLKYSQLNRDKLNEKACEKVYCECCKKNISYSYFSNQKKRISHIKNSNI